MVYRAPAARRRRRRRNSEDDSGSKTVLGAQKLRYQRLKQWFLDRVYRRRSSTNDQLVSSTLDRITYIDSTDSGTIMTDLDAETSSRQTVSVKRIKRTAVSPKEMEGKRNPSVRIVPVNRLASIDESKAIQSDSIKLSNNTSNNDERTSSSIQVDRVKKSSVALSNIEMHPIPKDFEPEMSISSRKISSAKSVTVTTVSNE